jgi:hypothetical protein
MFSRPPLAHLHTVPSPLDIKDPAHAANMFSSLMGLISLSLSKNLTLNEPTSNEKAITGTCLPSSMDATEVGVSTVDNPKKFM